MIVKGLAFKLRSIRSARPGSEERDPTLLIFGTKADADHLQVEYSGLTLLFMNFSISMTRTETPGFVWFP